MFEGFIGILAFFSTILAIMVGVILIFVALVTHRPRRAGRVALILLGWLGLYAVILLFVSWTSHPRLLDASQERCFDEICYSVTSVKVAHSLTNGWGYSFIAKGNYYVITVQLRNAALRTAQKPSNPELSVIDAQGKLYTHYIDQDMLELLGSATNLPGRVDPLWGQKIQPGETASVWVVFDLPTDVRQPGLVVSEGIGPLSAILIGDEGSFFHARTEILLKP